MSVITHRFLAVAAAAAVLGAASALVGGTPAAAATAVHVVSQNSATDSDSIKQVAAYCSSTERVVGGGGYVHEFDTLTRKPTLTELRPIHHYSGTRDAYRVTAAETTPGTASTWLVVAYAVCAPATSLTNWSIVPATSTPSSSSVQTREAKCATGRRALGSGISVSDPFGEVVLQVARTSGPGDITRAQAHEGVNGYAATWSVTAYAICATPPSGYVVPAFGASAQSDSEAWKIAGVNCPSGKVALGVGGALSSAAPANVSLQAIFPTAGGQGAQAIAVENTPTSIDWDFIVASAACAT